MLKVSKLKQAYCFVAELTMRHIVVSTLSETCIAEVKKISRKAHMGNMKQAAMLGTFICPSKPVAASTILVSPFGSLKVSFVA